MCVRPPLAKGSFWFAGTTSFALVSCSATMPCRYPGLLDATLVLMQSSLVAWTAIPSSTVWLV